MPIKACQGCLKDQFITTVEAIDCFTGKELWMWGRNASGNIGDNTLISKSSPVQTISGGTNWKYVESSSAGSGVQPSSSAGIKADGTLWTWGSSINGITGENTLIDRSSPVQTTSGGTNWRCVSLSSGGVAAGTKTDGSLWLWGSNSTGQLGNNSIVNASSSPVQTVSNVTTWKNVDVSAAHVTAIKTDGTLWTWGFGGNGELGNNISGNNNRASSPIQTISNGTNWQSVSSGTFVTLAVKTDGTLWAWGINDRGQLGLSDIVSRSAPTQMASNGTMWRSVSAGPFHGAGIKTDGTLWAWGRNDNGGLGDNNLINKSSPVQTISGGTNWRLVRAAHFNTRAIKTDGTLWSWGNGYAGTLGNNDLFAKSSPVQTTSNGTNWKSVSSGSYAASAIKEVEF